MNTTFTTEQTTYVQPPPVGSVQEIIPNQALQNVVFVVSSELDNPGTIPPVVADSFPYGVQDVYLVNQKLTQVFPVNAPPTP